MRCPFARMPRRVWVGASVCARCVFAWLGRSWCKLEAGCMHACMHAAVESSNGALRQDAGGGRRRTVTWDDAQDFALPGVCETARRRHVSLHSGFPLRYD